MEAGLDPPWDGDGTDSRGCTITNTVFSLFIYVRTSVILSVETVPGQYLKSVHPPMLKSQFECAPKSFRYFGPLARPSDRRLKNGKWESGKVGGGLRNAILGYSRTVAVRDLALWFSALRVAPPFSLSLSPPPAPNPPTSPFLVLFLVFLFVRSVSLSSPLHPCSFS